MMVIQVTNLDLKILNDESNLYDLLIAPLFGSFISLCKLSAKPKNKD